jgi:hypothetical protein
MGYFVSRREETSVSFHAGTETVTRAGGVAPNALKEFLRLVILTRQVPALANFCVAWQKRVNDSDSGSDTLSIPASTEERLEKTAWRNHCR